MWPYPSFESALSDVLKLSKAMTYKAALSGLSLGGGKSVIVGDPRKDKTPERLTAFARNVALLGGRYIVGEDVGIDLTDIELFRKVTPYVAGFKEEAGGAGDPSPATALGVFSGMAACMEEVFGNASFQKRRVAIQGVGKVGYALAKLLHQAGAHLYISDMDPERVAMGCREFNADLLHPHEIYRVDSDIFAPCALGGILNERILPALSCKIVAGSANNQLQNRRAAQMLNERGILYAPDYVINAGGLIAVAEEVTRRGERSPYSKEQANQKIKEIYNRLKEIFALARAKSILPSEAADSLAEERLAAPKPLQKEGS